MADIKPCPFCGSTEIKYEPTYTGGEESHGVMVCLQCGCTVPTSEFGRRVKEPYSKWNSRANKCDRDALLSVCAEIEDADVDGCVDWADRIRRAIGESEYGDAN